MTKEDKELLLKDLCARLPYGVIGEYSWKGRVPYNRELTGNLYDELNSSWNSTEDSKFIPYLRPMSSMTEEEFIYFMGLRGRNLSYHDICQMIKETFNMPNSITIVTHLYNYLHKMDWLLSNHFDVRGLIPKGLAIEVTEENNPYKE